MKHLLKIDAFNMKLCLLLLCCVFTYSTTWTPVEKKCPICGTKSRYYEIKSYGSYIYDYPTKYEYIFWPYTDGKVLYTCRKCWFTSFIWDFKNVPENKHNDIRKFLDSLALWETDGNYYVIPMSYRFIVAELIYQFLNKDDEFWCHFYRVMGYHSAREKKTKQAAQARSKALSIARKMLLAKKYAGIHKELYLITGAMRYLLDDKQGALRDFRQAQKLVFEKDGLDEEALENINQYLSDLLDNYIEKIEKNQVVFSATPTIAELMKSPEIFVDSVITVIGMLVNQGTGYFNNFRPAIEDNFGNAVRVLAWVPLEVPPSINPSVIRPKIMSDFLDKGIKANGYFRKDEKALFDSDYYFEVVSAEVISK